jgi:ribosomal protein S18 acetylase RimI-like enzyme
MDRDLPEIIRCPTERMAEALSLVLRDLAPSQRRIFAGHLLAGTKQTKSSDEALFIALRRGEICGAAWGQRQPGNVATFWPPQLATGENQQVALRLAEAVTEQLDATAVAMTQVLLTAADDSAVTMLTAVGFRYLAELLYLSCEAARFPHHAPSTELEFEPYREDLLSRVMRLTEQTYEDTLDCAALGGMRTMEDVLTGYRATGVFRPENWFIVRALGIDVGVLLLADHSQARHYELMYMGLVPRARGRGWGRKIAEYAQWRACCAGADRIVLAADAINTPAVRAYRAVGFEQFDRRTVYVRACGEKGKLTSARD